MVTPAVDEVRGPRRRWCARILTVAAGSVAGAALAWTAATTPAQAAETPPPENSLLAESVRSVPDADALRGVGTGITGGIARATSRDLVSRSVSEGTDDSLGTLGTPVADREIERPAEFVGSEAVRDSTAGLAVGESLRAWTLRDWRFVPLLSAWQPDRLLDSWAPGRDSGARGPEVPCAEAVPDSSPSPAAPGGSDRVTGSPGAPAESIGEDAEDDTVNRPAPSPWPVVPANGPPGGSAPVGSSGGLADASCACGFPVEDIEPAVGAATRGTTVWSSYAPGTQPGVTPD